MIVIANLCLVLIRLIIPRAVPMKADTAPIIIIVLITSFGIIEALYNKKGVKIKAT